MAKSYKDEHWPAIYVVAPDEGGPSKIGCTTDMSFRLEQLQSGCWLPLKCFDMKYAVKIGDNDEVIDYSLKRGAYGLENVVHQKLEELDVRLSGEWFDLCVQDASKAIKICARDAGYRCVSLADIAAFDMTGRADATMKDARNRMVASLASARINVDRKR